jgi:hypothetical protein
MTDYDSIADRYIDAWNTTDEDARRQAVAELYSADAQYTDPLAAVTGRDQICGLIAAVQSQFPGWTFRLTGPVDGHHDLLRFGWQLGPEGEVAPVGGFDAVLTGDDGRIQVVLGFLDRVPAAA